MGLEIDKLKCSRLELHNIQKVAGVMLCVDCGKTVTELQEKYILEYPATKGADPDAFLKQTKDAGATHINKRVAAFEVKGLHQRIKINCLVGIIGGLVLTGAGQIDQIIAISAYVIMSGYLIFEFQRSDKRIKALSLKYGV